MPCRVCPAATVRIVPASRTLPATKERLASRTLADKLLQGDAEQRELFRVGLHPDLLRIAAGDHR